MYSARRTVTTKSSSHIPVRAHSRTSAQIESKGLGGDLTGEGSFVNAVEAASASSKDSGCAENETIQESGSFTQSQVHSSRESFSAVSSCQSFTATELHLELEEDVGENDDFLKEELIHIFERERSTLELYFKNKMDDVLHRFRKNQMEWEEASRADKADMENAFTQERTAMQRSFGEEIAKLTRTFNEERAQLEQYYKEQLKELKEQARREQTDTEEKIAREKIDMKEKLEAEYQVRLKSEIAEGMKGAVLEKAELQAQLSQEKGKLEREYRLQLTKEEAKLQRLTTEMESQFQKERLELDQEFRQKLTQIEETLRQERELRYEAERQLEQERMTGSNTDSSRKQEIERLKNEIAELHRELDEKNRSVAMEVRTLEERILQGGREGLSGMLKSDFERLLAEHKMELDRRYQRDRETLEQSAEQKLQEERGKMEKERQWSRETSLRENGEMLRDEERQYTQKKETAENEIRNGPEVRRAWFDAGYEDKGHGSVGSRTGNEANCGGVRLQHHSSSGTGDQSQESDFYYVSPQNENTLRVEINGLRSENEGLKAKVAALEENIELHKKYKTEVQAEMERLQKPQAEHHKDNDELVKLQMELRDAQTKSRDYERKLNELRAQVKERERTATKADRSTRDVEAKVMELEKRIRVLEEMTEEADKRAKHAEDQLNEAKQQIREVSTMHTKGDKRPAADHKKFEEDWRPVEDYPNPERAKHENVLSERNKLLRVIKEQQRKLQYLQQKLRRLQESSLGATKEGRGMTEQTNGNAEQEQKVHELRLKLQELLERFKLEKQKVSSLEAELSSARSKYVDHIQQLEEKVQRTGQEIRQSEGQLGQDTLTRIEKEITSMSEMLKTQLSEKERELSGISVDQNEQMWKLQMDKQELELKLKMAREAMNEYVIKLNEKIKDMESGERTSDVIVQELHLRNSHLKATLKALEQEQLRSQFQNVELVQQKTELQSLIGKLCPAEDALTCSSLSASPRLHTDIKDRVMYGESGKAYVSAGSARREGYLLLKGSEHENQMKKDSSLVPDRPQNGNHENWSGNSARDTFGGPLGVGSHGLKAGFSNRSKFGSDAICLTDGHYSSQAGSRQFRQFKF